MSCGVKDLTKSSEDIFCKLALRFVCNMQLSPTPPELATITRKAFVLCCRISQESGKLNATPSALSTNIFLLVVCSAKQGAMEVSSAVIAVAMAVDILVKVVSL